MRKILYKEKNDTTILSKNKSFRSSSIAAPKIMIKNNYTLTARKAESKILVSNQQDKIQIPSLKLIKNKNIRKSSINQNADSPSINDEFSPYIYSQRTASQYNMQSYISSKRSIYKLQPQQNYETQVKLYDSALKQILYRQDQNELMDFDTRYYRCARQRRLRGIIKFLLKKSKDQQISLQDLIDNKITQARPYQSQGSFAFIFYVKKGLTDKVEQMLTSNPLHVHDFDEKLMTPLHIATTKQNVQMIKILISFGANIMAKDLTNNSVLYYAIQQNQIEIVRIFLSLQCPSDAQYLTYAKITKNPKIKKILKIKKLEDIQFRCSKYENLIEYISNLIQYCI